MHDSIDAAIRDVADDVPDEISQFLDVRYVDVSIGTQILGKVRTESTPMEGGLMQWAAAIWAS